MANEELTQPTQEEEPVGGGQDAATEEPKTNQPDKSKRGIAQTISKHKGLFAFGAMGSIFVMGFIALFLFLANFKLDHIRNILIDYRFARFHQQVAKRAGQLLTQEAVLSADSTGRLPTIRKGGVLEKLRGYNPEKAFKRLGQEGRVKLIYDSEQTSWIRRNQNSFKGIEIDGKRIDLSGATKADRINFAAQLEANIDTALPLKNKFFRSSLASDIRRLAGIKLRFWQKNGADYRNKTALENEKLARQEAASKTQTPERSTNIAGADDAKNDVRAAAAEGADNLDDVAKRAADRLPMNSGSLRLVRDTSLAIGVSTIFCLVYDVFVKNIDAVLSDRDTAYKNEAAALFIAADQQKEGDTTAEAVGATAARYDGFDNSAAYKRALGEPVTDTNPDLPPDLYPHAPFGSTVNGIVRTFDNIDSIIKTASVLPHIVNLLIPGADPLPDDLNDYCKLFLDPRVQIAGAAGELVALVVTTIASGGGGGTVWGTMKAAFQTIGVKGLFKLGATTGAIYFTADYLIPQAIKSSSGAEIGSTSSEQAMNQADVGTDLLANEFSRGAGGRPLTNGEVAELNRGYRLTELALAQKKGTAHRLLSLGNPKSVFSKFLAAIPVTPRQATAKFASAMTSWLRPTMMLASSNGLLRVFDPAYAYAADDGVDPYGIQQFGWSQAELDRMENDDSWTARANAEIVEPQLDALESEWGKCFNGRSFEITKTEGEGTDLVAKCASSDILYQRYRQYVFDNQILENMIDLQDDGSSETPASDAAPAGSSAQLAQQLLAKTSQITFTTTEAKQAMQDAADGKKSQIQPRCLTEYMKANDITQATLSANLLSALLAVSDKYKIGIGYLTNGCHSNRPTSMSAHYFGRGVDINTLNGQQSDGVTSLDTAFINDLINYLPQGSKIGQRQCLKGINTQNKVILVDDPCNHLHIQVP